MSQGGCYDCATEASVTELVLSESRYSSGNMWHDGSLGGSCLDPRASEPDEFVVDEIHCANFVLKVLLKDSKA